MSGSIKIRKNMSAPGIDVISGYAKIEHVLSSPICLNTNTVSWYDYLDLTTITKDGSNLVSRWNNKLGNGYDFIQAVSTNQPLWTSDGILFNGIDNCMATGVDVPLYQPYTAYLVLNQKTYNDGDILGAYSYGYGDLFQWGGTPNIKVYAGVVGSANGDLAVDTWGIVRMVVNGANSKLQVNDLTAVTGNFGSNSRYQIILASYAVMDGLFANVQFKELIFRSVADSEEDQTTIYTYLKTKYTL